MLNSSYNLRCIHFLSLFVECPSKVYELRGKPIILWFPLMLSSHLILFLFLLITLHRRNKKRNHFWLAKQNKYVFLFIIHENYHYHYSFLYSDIIWIKSTLHLLYLEHVSIEKVAWHIIKSLLMLLHTYKTYTWYVRFFLIYNVVEPLR